jgi:hypothetical protein
MEQEQPQPQRVQRKQSMQDDMRQYELWDMQRRIAKTRIDKFHALHMTQLWKQVWEDQDTMLCVMLNHEADLTDLIRRDRELAQQRQDGLSHRDGGRTDGQRP